MLSNLHCSRRSKFGKVAMRNSNKNASTATMDSLPAISLSQTPTQIPLSPLFSVTLSVVAWRIRKNEGTVMRILNKPSRAASAQRFWLKKFPVFDGMGAHTSAMRLSYRSTYSPSLESTGRKSEQPHHAYPYPHSFSDPPPLRVFHPSPQKNFGLPPILERG